MFGVKAWKGGWHDDLMTPLMDGYLGGRRLDAETARALSVWETYQALQIALYLEGQGRGEWTRHLVGVAESAILAGRKSDV